MFRVSPWITYDPAPEAREEGLTRTNNHFYNMPDDVEMDAPQISTLRDEETPEPQPTPVRTSKFRVKLLVNEKKAKKPASTASAAARKQPPPSVESEDDDDDDDEEEDQLIDDDDDSQDKKPLPAPSVSAPVERTRGTGTKRGAGGSGRGRGRGGGRRKTASRADTASASATTGTATQWTETVTAATVSAPSTRGKRGGGRGSRGRGRGSKANKIAVPPHVLEETGSISESYANTAASSPAAHDDHSPEPIDVISTHTITIPSTTSTSALASAVEDINLEGVPLPTYPLPNKPFPVQPPQKIGSGFAPIIPLDKSGKKVRHWRQVQREVRGIAGGRWFTKSWVGEKESDYATAAAAAAAAALQAASPFTTTPSASAIAAGLAAEREGLAGALPKLSGLAGARGPGRPRLHPKTSGLGTASALGGESAAATNPSSRAQSIVSDIAVSATKSLKRTHTQMSAGVSAADTPTASTPAP